MTGRDQQRALIVTEVVAGALTISEAAIVLGLSERQVWRLRTRFLSEGLGAVVHGNRGRPSPRRVDDALRGRVEALARGRYDGANDCHLTELLEERESITLGRTTVRRILRTAGLASPRPRRAPRHRRRRERMPQAGLLLQLDGSRHDWLEGRGSWLTLLAAIDDATNVVVAATFRAEEDSAGYFQILRTTIRRHGLPGAIYRDRHGSFEQPAGKQRAAELRLADGRRATQVGRALEELGIRSIAAHSPQAKGRIERLWGTFQDRLVTELRLAGAHDRASAGIVLRRFLPRHNRRFAIAPVDPTPAWRALSPGLEIDGVCCFRFRRVVANDHTIRIGGLVLDLPRLTGGRGYAGRRVEVQLRLDGRLIVNDRGKRLLSVRTELDPARLRSLEVARPVLAESGPTLRREAPGYAPPTTHPWNRATPGSRLERTRRQERRLTGSLNS